MLGAGSGEEAVEDTEDAVVTEFRMTIAANGVEVCSTVCSPGALDCLAVAHLAGAGYLKGGDRVTEVRWDPCKCLVDVRIEKGGGRAVTGGMSLPEPAGAGLWGAPKRRPNLTFSAAFICDVMNDLLRASSLFARTGGCHSAALCGSCGIVLRHDDIGRHNAVDKAVGDAVLSGITLEDKMLAMTGRISSDVVAKAMSSGIPVVVSKAPPTDLGIAMAEEHDITVVGFVRGRRLTVYSHRERIETKLI